MWFDAESSFSEHIQKTCKACFLQIHDLCRTRQYLTLEVAFLAAYMPWLVVVLTILTLCLEVCRVSYFHSLAYILTNRRKYAHVTSILK